MEPYDFFVVNHNYGIYFPLPDMEGIVRSGNVVTLFSRKNSWHEILWERAYRILNILVHNGEVYIQFQEFMSPSWSAVIKINNKALTTPANHFMEPWVGHDFRMMHDGDNISMQVGSEVFTLLPKYK